MFGKRIWNGRKAGESIEGRVRFALFLASAWDQDALSVACLGSEVGVAGLASLLLYRATQARAPHDDGILIGLKDGHAVPLGGTPSVDAASLTRIFGIIDSDSAQAMAKKMAQCLDPNGAWGFRFPFEAPAATKDSVVAAWMARGCRHFMPDGVWRDKEGGMLIRVTVLSRLARTYSWQPISYAFSVDARGVLIAWWLNDVGTVLYFDDGSLK